MLLNVKSINIILSASKLCYYYFDLCVTFCIKNVFHIKCEAKMTRYLKLFLKTEQVNKFIHISKVNFLKKNIKKCLQLSIEIVFF